MWYRVKILTKTLSFTLGSNFLYSGLTFYRKVFVNRSYLYCRHPNSKGPGIGKVSLSRDEW